jgi:hypothetical protein
MGSWIRNNAFFLANFFEYCVVLMKLVGFVTATDIHWNTVKRYGNNSIKFLLRIKIHNFNCVADPGCLCWIPDPNLSFRDPGSRVKKRPASNKYFKPKKNLFLSSRKIDLGCSSRVRIIFPSWIPDPGVKKAPDPGSATLHF